LYPQQCCLNKCGVPEAPASRRLNRGIRRYQLYFTVYVTVFSPSAGTSTGNWIVR